MNCVKVLQQNYIRSVNLILKAKYSRRSAKSTSSYKLIKSDELNADVENNEFDGNPNWELFGPRGFRFYLPGSVGPGWLDQSTTAQVETRSIVVSEEEFNNDINQNKLNRRKSDLSQPILHCVAQECPMLLRKGIMELFPGSVEAASPQLTIVTISQKFNPRIVRWSKEVETEKLAKFFLLAASDICTKLKMFGYWADFINPFSGQPYLNPLKNATLYKTDERFRCLGFRVDKQTSCKVITFESTGSEFIGSLYTTAPSSTEFLRDVMNGLSDN